MQMFCCFCIGLQKTEISVLHVSFLYHLSLYYVLAIIVLVRVYLKLKFALKYMLCEIAFLREYGVKRNRVTFVHYCFALK